jgi:hypothetical protein
VEAADGEKAKVGTLSSTSVTATSPSTRHGWCSKRSTSAAAGSATPVPRLPRPQLQGRRLRRQLASVRGFDPAVGATRSAKFCAHLTFGEGSCKDHERCYWVIDLERDQLTLPQQVDMIIAKHEEYDCMPRSVEANSYQIGLPGDRAEDGRAGVRVPVEPHYTTRTNKPDPETGVQAMSPWFERARSTSRGVTRTRSGRCAVVDELIQYPGRTTDTVMAFWFAWRRRSWHAPWPPRVRRTRRTSSNNMRRSSWRSVTRRVRALKRRARAGVQQRHDQHAEPPAVLARPLLGRGRLDRPWGREHLP